MKTFLRKHIEGNLVALTIVLVGLMVGCLVWGITYLSMNLNDVFNFKPTPAAAVQFNIDGASKLNLKGLVQ